MTQPLSLPGTRPRRTQKPVQHFPPLASAKRFTLDGDAGLERRLETICDAVRDRLVKQFPPAKLEAIVLGGGYGRGEGGVLRSPEGDKPYNDMEFYVFLRGNSLLNERRHGAGLKAIEHALSEQAGIEVEFKLHSRTRLERGAVSMFSYDLVMGNRMVLGRETLFEHCEQHRLAREIPLAEVTRLLMKRCSGLLYAKERLAGPELSEAEADFVQRNLAKLRLALGDVVLGAYGHYHWSCRERAQKLARIPHGMSEEWLDAVSREHRRGMAFKLHPSPETPSRDELLKDFQALHALSEKLWLWLEGLRLQRHFSEVAAYARGEENKCPETSAWRNFLINLREFGWSGVASASAFRYPRERLFRTLPLLLWQANAGQEADDADLLREQLGINTAKPPRWVEAYERIWQKFR